MGDHHQAVGAAAGGAGMVVARHQGGDGVGQVAGEVGTLGRRADADLGVEGEGRQPPAGLVGPADKAGDLSAGTLYVAKYTTVLSESTTLPPPVLLPVNMSFTRSAKSVSLSPERKSFSLFSMPVAPRLTGRYPITGE